MIYIKLIARKPQRGDTFEDLEMVILTCKKRTEGHLGRGNSMNKGREVSKCTKRSGNDKMFIVATKQGIIWEVIKRHPKYVTLNI